VRVTLAGVINAACNTCVNWNTEWALTFVSRQTGLCFWSLADGLPCGGTKIYLEIICPELRWPVPNVYWELGFYENGNFVGEFRRIFLGASKVDCSDVLMTTWVPSAHLPNPDQCDFRSATARIRQ